MDSCTISRGGGGGGGGGVIEKSQCHVRMGTPHFRDPDSLYLYEIGDPGPYLHIILWTLDPYNHNYEYGDHVMKLGTLYNNIAYCMKI